MLLYEVVLVSISVLFMLLYVALRERIFGFLGWMSFAVLCALKVPSYVVGEDYYNTAIFSLGSAFFTILGYSVLRRESDTFYGITSFSALACLIYFPFAIDPSLNAWLIETTTHLSVELGNVLGFPMVAYGNLIMMNGREVGIILPCTAIESISLFAGATLGVKADVRRRVVAFLLSVPTIYILNLFRNVFVVVSFSYSLFGPDSFYIAHNVIAKVLSTIALVIIAYAVFKVLPELADLIYDLKGEIVKALKS